MVEIAVIVALVELVLVMCLQSGRTPGLAIANMAMKMVICTMSLKMMNLDGPQMYMLREALSSPSSLRAAPGRLDTPFFRSLRVLRVDLVLVGLRLGPLLELILLSARSTSYVRR